MTSDLASRLSAKYDLRVPRYTSYPTAPHFSGAVTPALYRQWLGELDDERGLSLYLHIPYCEKMCWFCGCNTKITQQYKPIATYLDTLGEEIARVAEALPKRLKVRHIHWGGGSPTILNATDFGRLTDLLRARFDVEADAEIAVELDPRTANRDYVAAMAAAGVTRASIGVQDFNATVQEAVNRVQPYALVAEVTGWLRDFGIDEINMDLLYGLPYQTVDTVIETIDLALTLAPRRIALFGYAHVPWMKKHQTLIPDEALPDIDARWAQYKAAAALLAERGYVAIGLDHFALPDDELAVALHGGRLHRNFQGYTTDGAPALLGFGASAIGSLPQGYIQNNHTIHGYRAAIGGGGLATVKGIAVTPDDILRRAVIERLMCDLAVDLDDLARGFGRDGALFEPELQRLTPLIEDGVAVVDGRKVTMTVEGRPLVRAVCAVFDRYLAAGEQRHSKAV